MYKSILVHADLSRHADARIRCAAALARAHGACLTGAAMTGVSRAVFPHGYDIQPGTLAASYFEPLADTARRALERFSALAAEAKVAAGTRMACDRPEDALALLARFADLVVISQDDPDESLSDAPTRLPEYVILNCTRPVLVLPRTDPAPEACDTAHRILLAWDGSREAAAAVSAAMPLLCRAGSVTVLTLAGERAKGGEGIDPQAEQGELAAYLAHHHVPAPGFLVREAQGNAGHQLLAVAAELGCNLLVMGCYGHSRFRELCLGGASRTVLADAAIPVLMAH